MTIPTNPLFMPLMVSLLLNWVLAHLYVRRSLPLATRFEVVEERLLDTAIQCEKRHGGATGQTQEGRTS